MSGGPAELASRPPVVVVVAAAAAAAAAASGPTAPAALPTTGGSAAAPLLTPPPPPPHASAALSPAAGPPASSGPLLLPPPPSLAPSVAAAAPLPPPPPSGQRVFQEAVRQGNTRALQALLQGMSSCEFNVNSFGPEGQTALHQSVIDGNLELVKLLVKFGADIRLANRDGWSALHIAAFGGHQDIVLYLITKAKYSASGGAR